MDQVSYSDIFGLVLAKASDSWRRQVDMFSKILFTPPTVEDVLHGVFFLMTLAATIYGFYYLRVDYKIRLAALEKMKAKME